MNHNPTSASACATSGARMHRCKVAGSSPTFRISHHKVCKDPVTCDANALGGSVGATGARLIRNAGAFVHHKHLVHHVRLVVPVAGVADGRFDEQELLAGPSITPAEAIVVLLFSPMLPPTRSVVVRRDEIDTDSATEVGADEAVRSESGVEARRYARPVRLQPFR